MEDKIKGWLAKGGFPLEMKFVDSLLRENFEVAQSVYFQDLESEKFRETDIIATHYNKVNDIWVHITFVIECKKSVEKPWVILKNDEVINHVSSLLPIYHSSNASVLLDSIKTVDDFKSDLFFKNSRSIGYSVQTAFNSGIDKSFEAISSVTKACEYFSIKINERKNICAFYFPVILIEGRIFEGRLLKGDIEINEVNSSEVLVTRSFHKHGNSHILFFESSDLDFVSKKLKSLSSEFFLKYIKEIHDTTGN